MRRREAHDGQRGGETAGAQNPLPLERHFGRRTPPRKNRFHWNDKLSEKLVWTRSARRCSESASTGTRFCARGNAAQKWLPLERNCERRTPSRRIGFQWRPFLSARIAAPTHFSPRRSWPEQADGLGQLWMKCDGTRQAVTLTRKKQARPPCGSRPLICRKGALPKAICPLAARNPKDLFGPLPARTRTIRPP